MKGENVNVVHVAVVLLKKSSCVCIYDSLQFGVKDLTARSLKCFSIPIVVYTI